MPFQFTEFPFTREELEVGRPACENMRRRLEFLKKRVDMSVNIKYLKFEEYYTTTQIAKIVGVAESHVSRILNGRTI